MTVTLVRDIKLNEVEFKAGEIVRLPLRYVIRHPLDFVETTSYEATP